MIDGSGKRNRQLAFELQNLHVCEKCSLVIGKHLLFDSQNSNFRNVTSLNTHTV